MSEVMMVVMVLVYLAIIVYVLSLASRFVRAVERIADKYISKE